jgi:hypothetical protein
MRLNDGALPPDQSAARPLRSEASCKVGSRDVQAGTVLISLWHSSLHAFYLRSSFMPRGLCASWQDARPYVLDDLPISLWLASVDDYVATFGGDSSPGRNRGHGLLKVAAVVSQIAGGF